MSYKEIFKGASIKVGAEMKLEDNQMKIIFDDKQLIINEIDCGLNPSIDISDKIKCCEHFEKLQVPFVEFYPLSNKRKEARRQAGFYVKKNGKVVVRGNSGFSGVNTYICKSMEQARKAVDALFNKNVQVFLSPYYDAPIEYRAMMIEGKMIFGVVKYRNADGFHNLSKGASSGIITDKAKFKEVEQMAAIMMNGLGLKAAGIDIMETKKGLKALEISIPNVGKFYKNNLEYREEVIQYFSEVLQLAFNNTIR